LVTATTERALFERLPRLPDLVPFVSLADGLPTAVDQVDERLWVKRDNATSSVYGGNKVRKFEFVLPVAERRAGPVVTAGGIGSHHVLAAAVWCNMLGLHTEAVLYPQPVTEDVRHTQAELRRVGARITLTPHRYLMPVTLAQRLAALARHRPYLLWPGASTPLGTLGYVSAGLELVASGIDEPDSVVVSLGSGGTAVGLALGMTLGGWRKAKVVATRAADVSVTNMGVLRALEAGTAALLALGGWRPQPGRLVIEAGYFGPGYGHPTEEGTRAAGRARAYGFEVEPTYTAKAFACALHRCNDGERVVFVQTYAGAEPAG
jgi:D-cysteine desulfhydrase